MRKVVHFEIPADDLDRAKNFYGSVFGWNLQTTPMPGGGEYTSVMTTPVDEQTQVPTEPGAINGGMFSRSGSPDVSSPVITIDVDAIDDALAQVESSGGTIVTPRTAIEGMGAFAYFKDPEGNIVGLWETATQ
jgi:predicted enzyme related to lactoylglutathione lyase